MKNLTLILTTLLAVSCSNKSASIYGSTPAQQPADTIKHPEIPADEKLPAQNEPKPDTTVAPPAWISQDGGKQKIEFNPKIDILFVIDNSDSMKDHEINLASNIDKFVDKFGQNKMIDFHIGVTEVWDSTPRYLKAKADPNTKDPYACGELRFAKDASGKTLTSRYVTRSANYTESLARTLNIGIMAYKDGGPEVEELLSPIDCALKLTGPGQANEGFFRDDAQLVVVIVTDADDSTANISPDQMAQELVDFKGGDANKVSVYGVLVRANDPDVHKDYGLRIMLQYHPECFNSKTHKNNGQCKGFGPDILNQFVVLANSDSGTASEIKSKFILPINQVSYGSDLARVGADISKKLLKKEIQLDQLPQVDENGLMIRVRYGTDADLAANKAQVIPQASAGGWSYTNQDNANKIILSGDISYKYQDNAHLLIEYVPLVPTP